MIQKRTKRIPLEVRIQRHSERVKKEEPAYNYLSGFDTGMSIEELQEELEIQRTTISMLERKIGLFESTDFLAHVTVRDKKLRELKKARNKWVFYLEKGKFDKIEEVKQRIRNLYGEVEQCENIIVRLCREHEVNPSGYLRLNEVPKPK